MEIILVDYENVFTTDGLKAGGNLKPINWSVRKKSLWIYP